MLQRKRKLPEIEREPVLNQSRDQTLLIAVFLFDTRAVAFFNVGWSQRYPHLCLCACQMVSSTRCEFRDIDQPERVSVRFLWTTGDILWTTGDTHLQKRVPADGRRLIDGFIQLITAGVSTGPENGIHPQSRLC